jgi:lipopolysaccharide biosynthesis glycosyltransferase
MMKSNAKAHVLFCCNPEYFQHLAVAIASLLDNNKNTALTIHVVSSRKDQQLEEKLRKSIKLSDRHSMVFYFFDVNQYGHFYIGDTHFTLETYIRIFAAEILPHDIEKVLYLDADLVVVDNVLPLWHTCVDDYVLAAVKDPHAYFRMADLSIPPSYCYVNAGVLLINLRKWRDFNLTPQIVDFIENNKDNLIYVDQDAINAVLFAAIRRVDYRWNLQARMYRPLGDISLEDQREIRAARNNPAIIHYSSNHKPWVFSVHAVPMSYVYYRYLDGTEWRGSSKEGFSWLKAPEYYVVHFLDRCGLNSVFLEKYDNSITRMLRRMLRCTFGVARLLHERRYQRL